jgi:hypothetical protein
LGTPKRRDQGPFIRTRSIWEDNIKTDLWEIVLKDVDLTHLAQNREQWYPYQVLPATEKQYA